VFVDVQTTLEIFEQNPISSQNGKHFYFSCESVLNCNGMPISFVLPWKGGDGFAEFADAFSLNINSHARIHCITQFNHF